MGLRLCFAILVLGLLHFPASAGGSVAMLFQDGRWSGGVVKHPDSAAFEECWASTTFVDGTVLTLAKRRDENWSLRLSNPAWRLAASGDSAMIAQVDFYRPLQVTTRANGLNLLEIPIRGDQTLLDLIENGHLIKFNSDSFNKSYDLEGSAKIIERIRICVSEQRAGEQ